MIWGMRNLLKKMGAINIMVRTKKNIHVGFAMGSCKPMSSNHFMIFANLSLNLDKNSSIYKHYKVRIIVFIQISRPETAQRRFMYDCVFFRKKFIYIFL
jgi:hypothetical protein